LALVVRLWAIRTLGRYWSLHLEIRQDHQLVTEGVYRHMRHPAYSAIMLEVVSVPLVANAYGMLVFAIGWYVTLILLRWHREEREMVSKFGEQYEQYRREVPAFVPWRIFSTASTKQRTDG
jgi:protein-S-isoprenylcysteine O-methyltransferase Ste14